MPRSRTLALARKSDAVTLFRRGKTFDQIAEAVGYANRGTAHRVVTRAFRDRIVEDVDEHRQLEVERLDAIQAEMWPLMASGDIQAARLIIKIIGERSRLLGLHQHPTPGLRLLVDPSLGNTRKATPSTRLSSDPPEES